MMAFVRFHNRRFNLWNRRVWYIFQFHATFTVYNDVAILNELTFLTLIDQFFHWKNAIKMLIICNVTQSQRRNFSAIDFDSTYYILSTEWLKMIARHQFLTPLFLTLDTSVGVKKRIKNFKRIKYSIKIKKKLTDDVGPPPKIFLLLI